MVFLPLPSSAYTTYINAKTEGQWHLYKTGKIFSAGSFPGDQFYLVCGVSRGSAGAHVNSAPKHRDPRNFVEERPHGMKTTNSMIPYDLGIRGGTDFGCYCCGNRDLVALEVLRSDNSCHQLLQPQPLIDITPLDVGPCEA